MPPRSSTEKPDSRPNGKARSSPKAKSSPKVNDKTDKTSKTKSGPKSEASSSPSDFTKPLFARPDPTNSKTEDLESVLVIKKATSSKSKASDASRISRGRQKPTLSKLADLSTGFQTELEKNNGVIVNCAYLAQDGKATYHEQSQEWNHILQLRSDLPFSLIKSKIITTGPYQNHVALIIRQETPFRLLALPLHIRTKIYSFALKHHEPAISIVPRKNTRTVCAPTYYAPNTLAILRASKAILAEAAPIVYTQPFTFPGTQVVCDFLVRIARNRRFIRSLASETYTTKSARNMFNLLSEARALECLSFEHVSSNESPVKAVKNIWTDGGAWLAGIDRNKPTKGLDILKFDAKAFHTREKDKRAGEFKITCWGPAEQLEFLKGLRAKMVAEGQNSAITARGEKQAVAAGSKKPLTLAQTKKPTKAD